MNESPDHTWSCLHHVRLTLEIVFWVRSAQFTVILRPVSMNIYYVPQFPVIRWWGVELLQLIVPRESVV